MPRKQGAGGGAHWLLPPLAYWMAVASTISGRGEARPFGLQTRPGHMRGAASAIVRLWSASNDSGPRVMDREMSFRFSRVEANPPVMEVRK